MSCPDCPLGVCHVCHLSQPARTFLSPEECERGAWSRGAEEGKRVPAGIDPSPEASDLDTGERRRSSAVRMESQDAPDALEAPRGFICASFNQDTT